MDATTLADLTEAFFKVEMAKFRKFKLDRPGRQEAAEAQIHLELAEAEYERVLRAAFHQEEGA